MSDYGVDLDNIIQYGMFILTGAGLSLLSPVASATAIDSSARVANALFGIGVMLLLFGRAFLMVKFASIAAGSIDRPGDHDRADWTYSALCLVAAGLLAVDGYPAPSFEFLTAATIQWVQATYAGSVIVLVVSGAVEAPLVKEKLRSNGVSLS